VRVCSLPDTEADDVTTIVPLFKLVKGISSSSAGFSCAALAGVPTPVVKRAETVAEKLRDGSAIAHLPTPLLSLGPSELSSAFRFNARSQEVYRAFLTVDDWANCSDETLTNFKALLCGCY
jgi:DNA mismatch repair ATPase MutS